jgi:hypothetical protein
MLGWIQHDALRFLQVLECNDCLYRRGCWSMYWASLCTGQGGSHTFIDYCNARIVQRRWRGRVLTLNCTVYRTPFLRGISLPSLYRNMTLRRRKLRIPRRPMPVLILTINKTFNVLYERSCVSVWPMGIHSPIYMFDINTVGIIACSCISNTRQGRFQFERRWRVSTTKGGTV